MDTDLVIRAQRGDKEAYALVAAEIADRFLAVARRILRDLDLAEDATQQALLATWQNLPQLRDPARFEAWSYRLLVRACYAEGRLHRRWAPNLRVLPVDGPAADDDLSSVVDRDQLERGFRRLSIDHRAVVVLHHYLDLPIDRVPRFSAFRPGRPTPDFTTRCAGCVRRSTPTRGHPCGRLPSERRTRHHAHRPVVASHGRARVRGPSPRRCSRPAGRDPTAPVQVADAEVRQHEHVPQGHPRSRRDRGRRGRCDQPAAPQRWRNRRPGGLVITRAVGAAAAHSLLYARGRLSLRGSTPGWHALGRPRWRPASFQRVGSRLDEQPSLDRMG